MEYFLHFFFFTKLISDMHCYSTFWKVFPIFWPNVIRIYVYLHIYVHTHIYSLKHLNKYNKVTVINYTKICPLRLMYLFFSFETVSFRICFVIKWRKDDIFSTYAVVFIIFFFLKKRRDQLAHHQKAWQD